MSRELSLPRVRIEWIPVQMYGLGHLGFDYLQLVFEPGDAGAVTQDPSQIAPSDETLPGLSAPPAGAMTSSDRDTRPAARKRKAPGT